MKTYEILHEQLTPRGPWQQTNSGNAFFVMDPRPEEVRLEDIAWPLALQCRYNGHVRFFYSVAQHAVMVSELMESHHYPVKWQFAALHHDSGEAYTGDIVSQVKYAAPEVREVTKAVQRAVEAAFGIDQFMDKEVEDAVKYFDLMALATEARDVVGPNRTPLSWGALPIARKKRIAYGWRPETAEAQFLVRHHTLVEKIERSS